MAKILIADDKVAITKAVERLLQSNGHSVDVCTNGDEAIDLIKKYDYDLIVTDILMPEKDGLEVAKFVRLEAPKSKRETPILAITGGGTLLTSQMATEAAKIHTDFILTKPFETRSFLDAVNNLLTEKPQARAL